MTRQNHGKIIFVLWLLLILYPLCYTMLMYNLIIKSLRMFAEFKKSYNILNNRLHLAWKYAPILVHWHIYLFWEVTVFWECSSRKTVSFEEHITSKDKYLSIFSCQIKAIVFKISFKYFLQHMHFWKLGNGTEIFLSFSWGIFRSV